MQRLAIVSAMAQEFHGLRDHLSQPACVQHAGRELWTGLLAGVPVVLALSRIGKVAAATTTSSLLSAFPVDRVFFTGAAGGLGDGVQVGDIVVAETLLQHDMDASPLFPRHEVPLYGHSHFPADAALTGQVLHAARGLIDGLARPAGTGPTDRTAAEAALQRALAGFGLGAPRLHRGLVISGDRFVSSGAESQALRDALPQALAVEMEGAAVAQVCHDFGVPFAVLRTVSDRADDSAHVDFNRFIAEVASRYTVAIVLALLAHA